MRKYRFFPIYGLAFSRLLFFSIYNLALPIFLLTDRNVSESTIGILQSSYSFAYILGPFIGMKVGKYISTKKSIILSCYLSIIATSLQVFYTEPVLIFCCRVIAGISLGLFWPNLQKYTSKWKKTGPNEKSTQILKKYSWSWNGGLIFGLLLGYFIVYYWGNNYVALQVSVFLSLIMIPLVYLLEEEKSDLKYENGIAYLHVYDMPGAADEIIFEDSHDHPPLIPNSIKDKNHLLLYPFLFSIIINIAFAFNKGLFSFNYIICVDYFNQPSEMVYLISFITQLLQISAIHIMSTKKLHILIQWLNPTFIFTIVISLLSFLIHDFWVISICTLLYGLCHGIFYSITTNIMLDHMAECEDENKNHASLYESAIGIGFAFAPFLGGFVSEIDLFVDYLLIAGINIVALLVFIYLRFKIGIKKIK